MDSVEKYINDETSDRFLNKIFRRHDTNKDGYLDWDGIYKFLI
jgi:Ca2+-binding EF-hand superfamily protein